MCTVQAVGWGGAATVPVAEGVGFRGWHRDHLDGMRPAVVVSLCVKAARGPRLNVLLLGVLMSI